MSSEILTVDEKGVSTTETLEINDSVESNGKSGALEDTSRHLVSLYEHETTVITFRRWTGLVSHSKELVLSK